MAIRPLTVGVAAMTAILGSSGTGFGAEVDCSVAQHAQRLINHCSSVGLKMLDGQLAAVYERLLGSISDPSDRARLRTAQDAWLRFREAHCAFEAPPSRLGSLVSAKYTACARVLTEARITQLRSNLECLSGPDSCRR